MVEHPKRSWAELLRGNEPSTMSLGDAVARYLREDRKDLHSQPCLRPRGLINIGNICFMNCVLQSLIHCEPFYDLMTYLDSKVQFKIKSTTPILDGMIEFIREYGQEDNNINANGGPATNTNNSTAGLRIDPGYRKLSPYLAESFYNIISSHHKFKHLQRGMQEDAEEFLGYLLDALDDELREAVEKRYPGTPAAADSDLSQWVEVGKHNRRIQSRHAGNTKVDTPIRHIFGGRFKSVLSSPAQKSSSVTYDPFQHIQLDISDPEVDSIQLALDSMFQPEIIPYNTGKGFQVNATKQVTVDRVPKVLIVHLKRFSYTGCGQITKITKPIELTRDLSLSSPSAMAHYRLFSVVYHHGPSATAGHYTVDLQTYAGPWTGIDDIVLLDGSHDGPPLDSKTAYLLFYIKL